MAKAYSQIAFLLGLAMVSSACSRKVDYLHTQKKGKPKAEAPRPKEEYAFTERKALPPPAPEPMPELVAAPTPVTRSSSSPLVLPPPPSAPEIASSPIISAPRPLTERELPPLRLPDLPKRPIARTRLQPSFETNALALLDPIMPERMRPNLEAQPADISKAITWIPISPPHLSDGPDPLLDLPLITLPLDLTHKPVELPEAIELDTETFVQGEISHKFDLMFIVDNSDSMLDIKEYVRQNLQKIIEPLALKRQQLDWRAAVTITDPIGRAPWFYRTPSNQAFVGGKSPLAAADWEQVQKDWNSVLGQITTTRWQGWEQGLQAAAQSLSNDFRNFARKEAHLVVIWLSDEDDFSAQNWKPLALPNDRTDRRAFPELHRDLWTPFEVSSYKKYFEDVEKLTGGDVLLYPIVHNDREKGPVCDNQQPDKPPSVGLRYLELVESWDRSRAEALSLCQVNLVDSFQRIVDKTADVDVCFQLKHPLKDLVVTVEMEEIPPSDYTVRSGKEMRVCFLGDFHPQVGQTIQISGTRLLP